MSNQHLGQKEILFDLFKKAIAPAIAVFLLYQGAIDIGPALRALNGEGRHGVLVIREVCDWDDDCVPYGNFYSADRRHIMVGANWYGPEPVGLRAGHRLPALDTGDRDGVFPPEGSVSAVVWTVVVLILGAGVLLVWAYWVLIRPRHQRTQRHQRRRA